LSRLPTTRRSLILRLADRHDVAAWTEFLEVYERAVFRFARSRGLQAADAEDVTQRVLAVIVEKAPTWNADPARGRFRGWVLRVARNLSARARRDQRYRPRTAEDSIAARLLEDITAPGDDADDPFEAEYRKALFHWAVERVRDVVKDTTWQAFWQTAVEGREPTLVAEALGVSLATVYTAKCRMLAKIRGEVDRFESRFDSFPTES
jgi:RNA polymerase sigma-70 factor (ECF subfamily)